MLLGVVIMADMNVKDFDLQALYAAMDEKRRARDLTWVGAGRSNQLLGGTANASIHRTGVGTIADSVCYA